MTKAGHMIETEDLIGKIRISEVGTTLEMIGIQVNIKKLIEETFKNR